MTARVIPVAFSSETDQAAPSRRQGLRMDIAHDWKD
jgi:hypothetical protein